MGVVVNVGRVGVGVQERRDVSSEIGVVLSWDGLMVIGVEVLDSGEVVFVEVSFSVEGKRVSVI